MTTKSEIEQLIKDSDQLLNELGWTVEQAREHLVERYNKRSRFLLDINEWADYLQSLRVEKALKETFPAHERPDLLDLVNRDFKRVGWDSRQIISYVLKNYGKLTIKLLNPSQLEEVFSYLHSLPTKGNSKETGELNRLTKKPHRKKPLLVITE